MHAKSHYHLGKFLIRRHLPYQPRRYHLAFLLGCTEPDKNPATYLKGSLRCCFLRGHHWSNSQRYMQRIARRLENRRDLKLLDYYTLGKLIHYTTDAFTYAHNAFFTAGLTDHRAYEALLHKYFLSYLAQEPQPAPDLSRSVMDTIRSYHSSYIRKTGSIHRDCFYTVTVCCSVLTLLIPSPFVHKQLKFDRKPSIFLLHSPAQRVKMNTAKTQEAPYGRQHLCRTVLF